MNVLAINGGSATLKYKLYHCETGDSEQLLISGVEDHAGKDDFVNAAKRVFDKCQSFGIDAIGYRVVHGGTLFYKPTRMNADALAELSTLADVDPLHNPAEVAMIRAGLQLLPATPAAAVFDTAFHHTIAETAWRFAIPRDFADKYGLRRFGFHGISYSYITKELLGHLGRSAEGTKLILCHLGSGASVCAVQDGRSIDTSMGMTPLEGLIMGTRAGDIDPGMLLHVLRLGLATVDELDYLLNDQSGMLGLSGISNDVRTLENASDHGDENAKLALRMFAYRVSQYIGAYSAVLGGVDALAFAGGIGEHSPQIRALICKNLAFLGIRLEETLNDASMGQEDATIGNPNSPTKVWVIATNEELEVVRETFKLIGGAN